MVKVLDGAAFLVLHMYLETVARTVAGNHAPGEHYDTRPGDVGCAAVYLIDHRIYVVAIGCALVPVLEPHIKHAAR